jgi:hypothetical protein
MWIEKMMQGVLRILTPLGPRYLRPTCAERLYLLWIFRNFETLPAKVLSRRQQRWIEALCARHGYIAMFDPSGLWEIPLLGTLEQRPPVEEQVRPPRRPSRSVSEAVAPFAADMQQRS